MGLKGRESTKEYDPTIVFDTYHDLILKKFKIVNNRKISTNPENGNEYLLPTQLDDKKNIDDFLSKNENKKVIVVQGLGFVGSVMSFSFVLIEHKIML